eukprot:CAMPEP_0194378972 /NCGR_PEP_ID=MMETSP0174-20130528/37237_1 /TAXON_ID=216777 /ORGANISM="Proboscia alata, Strain PI-D3" /LENGTH=102 /DNA_ID=CAMNT_0039161341 /DNA_START=42 /DNA_END=347 /DNA_ORIENTATION=-
MSFDDDAPSWLSDDNDTSPAVAELDDLPLAPEVKPPSKISKKKAAAAAAAVAAAPSPPPQPVDESDLPRIVMWMRISNVSVAVAIITLSVLNIISVPGISEW